MAEGKLESSDSIRETFSHPVCTCVYLYIPVCVTAAYLHSGALVQKEKGEFELSEGLLLFCLCLASANI